MKLRLKSKARWAFATLGFVGLVFLAIGRTEPPVTLASREAVLRTDLRTIRDAIDNYTLDKGEPPHSLQDLVDAGYLRAIPVDPITKKWDWLPDFESPVLADPVLSPDLQTRGLVGVHSNSNRISPDGTKYSEW